MVLLTEIGFLCESLVLEYELKAKLGGAEGADGDTPSPCSSFALASFVVLVDNTFGWLRCETTVSPCFAYLRA